MYVFCLSIRVKKKSVHMSDHNVEKTAEKKKEKRKKRKRARKTADLDNDLEPITASPSRPSAAAPPAATVLPSDGSVRRPPSAFNRPRPTLDELPYENFVSPRMYEHVDSVSDPPRSPSTGRHTARIMIESDDER